LRAGSRQSPHIAINGSSRDARDANAEFVRALAHCVRNYAVESDRRGKIWDPPLPVRRQE